ncbi:MAG: hypothetical protein LBT00_02725 [Spirochaetaceae bacterium]|nr:hypothetical protein [Spirochaetaceae bacterium]
MRGAATKQSRRRRPSTGSLRFARNDIGTVVIARSKATKQSRRRRFSTGLLRFARNDRGFARNDERGAPFPKVYTAQKTR